MYTHASAAVASRVVRRLGRLNGDVDGRCARVPEYVGQCLLDRAIDSQLRCLPGWAERMRNIGLNCHLGAGLPPEPHQRSDRLAKTEFGQADRSQPVKDPP